MDKLWMWGYTLTKIPQKCDYVYTSDGAYCSLETAARYLNADNTVLLNTAEDLANLTEEQFCYLNDCKEVIVALTHHKYVESAIEIAKFSKTHKNITGVIIDDFLMYDKPSGNMTVAELKEVYESMKSINPDLKLWVVRYSRYDIDEIDPYLDYIDGINFWIWCSTEHYWKSVYKDDIVKLMKKGKPIIQGVFLHDYGEEFLKPMDMEMLKLQMPKIADCYRLGQLDGIVFLQNGWLNREDHREAVQWTKAYWEWFFGTLTVR